jgi:hypothetical protein
MAVSASLGAGACKGEVQLQCVVLVYSTVYGRYPGTRLG